MAVRLQVHGPEALSRYAQVPISFEVSSEYAIELADGSLGGLHMAERPVDEPYIKDYDASDDGGPDRWPEQFDVSNWTFILALNDADAVVGAAAVARDTPGVHMLEARSDLAVLWDIRVAPECRRQGVGRMLFAAAAQWARERGCVQLKVETQNVNVRACRFYASQGCQLGAIHRFGYAAIPHVAHEAMLLWYLDLG